MQHFNNYQTFQDEKERLQLAQQPLFLYLPPDRCTFSTEIRYADSYHGFAGAGAEILDLEKPNLFVQVLNSPEVFNCANFPDAVNLAFYLVGMAVIRNQLRESYTQAVKEPFSFGINFGGQAKNEAYLLNRQESLRRQDSNIRRARSAFLEAGEIKSLLDQSANKHLLVNHKQNNQDLVKVLQDFELAFNQIISNRGTYFDIVLFLKNLQCINDQSGQNYQKIVRFFGSEELLKQFKIKLIAELKKPFQKIYERADKIRYELSAVQNHGAAAAAVAAPVVDQDSNIAYLAELIFNNQDILPSQKDNLEELLIRLRGLSDGARLYSALNARVIQAARQKAGSSLEEKGRGPLESPEPEKEVNVICREQKSHDENFDFQPERLPFDIRQQYLRRIISFANGAILAINNSSKEFEGIGKKIKDLIDKQYIFLTRLSEGQLLQQGTFTNELFKFQKKLLNLLNSEPYFLGLSLKDLALAEAMYVWQNVPAPVIRTRYRDGDLYIEQKETPVCFLTKAQKDQLQKIWNTKETQPQWYKKLPLWAKKYLKSIIQHPSLNVGNPDWETLYKNPIPAILRCIPGEANAWGHELIITRNGYLDKEGEVVYQDYSRPMRQGVPTSYDMPDSERQESANENLAQMLEYEIVGKDARKNFIKYWQAGERIFNWIDTPVLLCGLLNPHRQAGFLDWVFDRGKEKNELLDVEKKEALDKYEKRPGFKFFNINIAVNGWRDEKVLGDAEVINQFIQHAKKIYNAVLEQNNPANANKLLKLRLAIQALEEVKKLAPIPNRNRNLFFAALLDVTTRLMGGVSTGNCKSSKDRKGMEQLYADAILIYFAKFKKFPRYNDQESDRGFFIQICCDLYRSGHQLKVADANSPGSSGAKDDGTLDKDVLEALGKDYALSAEMAEFNKAGNFYIKYVQKPFLVLSALSIVAGIILTATGILSPIGLVLMFLIPSLINHFARDNGASFEGQKKGANGFRDIFFRWVLPVLTAGLSCVYETAKDCKDIVKDKLDEKAAKKDKDLAPEHAPLERQGAVCAIPGVRREGSGGALEPQPLSPGNENSGLGAALTVAIPIGGSPGAEVAGAGASVAAAASAGVLVVEDGNAAAQDAGRSAAAYGGAQVEERADGDAAAIVPRESASLLRSPS